MPQSKEPYDAILNSDARKAHAATQLALATGVAPMTLITESMIPAMTTLNGAEFLGTYCDHGQRRRGQERRPGAA